MVQQIIKLAINFERWTKTALFITSDLVVLILGLLLALRLAGHHTGGFYTWPIMTILSPITILTCHRLGLYQTLARHLSAFTLKLVGLSSLVSTAYLFGLFVIFEQSLSVVTFGTYLASICLGFSAIRLLVSQIYLQSVTKPARVVAIYGAGDAGRQLLKGLIENKNYRPVFFIDDNPQLQNMRVLGIKVFSLEVALNEIEAHGVEMILLAMPSAETNKLRDIFLRLSSLPVQLKSLPGLAELIDGKVRHEQLRTLSIEDLLGRQPVPPIQELIQKNLHENVVMVTGAGGTIGSELCCEIVRNGATKLILFDSSEFALYTLIKRLEIEREKDHFKTEIHAVIGTVQNELRLIQILTDFVVDTIYHAAAYKHVPIIEENVFEGFKNNSLGTYNLARAAMNTGVKEFIQISTDKAVRPTNYMGASKRLAELVCHHFNKSSSETRFSIVRFGNVIGSSGSVIPLFAHQIETGSPLTVTHKNVTRYFMTVKEAAQLVIQAASLSKDGNIFILDMGEPVRILDVARRMASLDGRGSYIVGEENADDNAVPIKIIGLRPGEKLHEELSQNNDLLKTVHPRIFMASEEFSSVRAFPAEIEALEAACQNRDRETLKRILNRLPIEFNHQKNMP
ncbi:putative nucleoside-diphosphate sugar epimerase [SAR116 cluster alpha proteobacterium HIMB100]|nr:putative nucleoside-diphosphate sugar epimerase [SAR116 cluster alpha proteobacterium HIMB100]